MSLKDAIQSLNKTQDGLFLCTVTSVDEANRTCNATTVTGVSGIEIKDVMLMAALDDGLLLTPAVDSNILVIKSEKVPPYAIMYSELTKVSAIVGDNNVEITSDGIQLSGNTFGGLIKIQELVTKINRLESKVDDLITKYNSHIHITTATVGATPTPGVIAPTTTSETPIGTQTQKSDLENETIKHGSGI